MKSPAEIEQFFHTHIPLTRAMGVRVVRYTPEELALSAPLALNHNHLGTAFGGSLHALATLAGYGLVWLELGDTSAHVVIRESRIAYRNPVRNDPVAVCRRPDADRLAGFLSDFARKGKARIDLSAEISDGDEAAVEFTGTFVAIR